MNQTINELARKAVVSLQKNNSGRLARLKSLRKLWLKVHLYLGLFAGAVLLVIGNRTDRQYFDFLAGNRSLAKPRLDDCRRAAGSGGFPFDGGDSRRRECSAAPKR
jgi:hypothetical protein